jgi:hypothetical protein
VAAAVAIGVRRLLPVLPPWLAGGIVLGFYGVAYVVVTSILRAKEAEHLVRTVRRRLRM